MVDTKTYHSASVEELAKKFQCPVSGLGREEVEKRLDEYGRNKLRPRKKNPRSAASYCNSMMSLFMS